MGLRVGHLRHLRNEEGSVLVAALLFMVILALIGTSAIDTSTVEQQIAANDKFHKIAFQNADSGISAIPKVISACLDAGSENVVPVPPGIFVLDVNGDWDLMDVGDGTFYREMMGYNAHDTDADVRMVLDNNPVEVDVERLGSEILSGGGAEFGSGAEGLGSGSAGSSAIVYREISTGSGPSDSISVINAVYRKVLGIPGGL